MLMALVINFNATDGLTWRAKMTTLIAQDEETTLEVKLAGYTLADGDMLLVGIPEEIEKAMDFLINEGLSGVYFGPDGKTHAYNGFLEMSAVTTVSHGILLFKHLP